MYLTTHDRIILPDGSTVSWNDDIIVDLIRLYYKDLVTGVGYYSLPISTNSLSANQKLVYAAFQKQKPNGMLITYSIGEFFKKSYF